MRRLPLPLFHTLIPFDADRWVRNAGKPEPSSVVGFDPARVYASADAPIMLLSHDALVEDCGDA